MKTMNKETFAFSKSLVEDVFDHRAALLSEITLLKSRFRPEDTGNIRTAVSVLEHRVEEINDSFRLNVEV
mgnify:FL=1